MIAINWFEVLLPSMSFEIPVEHLTGTSPIPRRVKTVEHRTVLRSMNGEGKALFHITASPPARTETPEVDFQEDPSLAKYVIEHGFATRLQQSGFEVRLMHVGGVGRRGLDTSIRPLVYRATEGIRFRCFYGFDRGEPVRWGLILSYVTGQRFRVSLVDAHLRQLALGKRVVQIDLDDESASEDLAEGALRSGILESVQGDQAVLVDQAGDRHFVSLERWTLPCRLDNLLGYIRSVEGGGSASEVATKLQQQALTLTAQRRMNTSLARDQLEKLRALMLEEKLYEFNLLLPKQSLARVVQKPLVIGD